MTIILLIIAVVLAASVVALVLLTKKKDEEVASAAELVKAADLRASETKMKLTEVERKLSSTEKELSEALSQATLLRTHLSTAESRASERDKEATRLGTELTEARLAAEIAAASPQNATRWQNRLASLWQLTHLNPGVRDITAAWSAQQTSLLESPDALGLRMVLGAELGRIREEVGTPASLTIDLREDPPPAEAVVVYEVTKSLLSMLVPHSQACDLVISSEDTGMSSTVTCDGWEGPEMIADDIATLLRAVEPFGADVGIDADEQGRLVARVTFPSHS